MRSIKLGKEMDNIPNRAAKSPIGRSPLRNIAMIIVSRSPYTAVTKLLSCSIMMEKSFFKLISFFRRYVGEILRDPERRSSAELSDS